MSQCGWNVVSTLQHSLLYHHHPVSSSLSPKKHYGGNINFFVENIKETGQSNMIIYRKKILHSKNIEFNECPMMSCLFLLLLRVQCGKCIERERECLEKGTYTEPIYLSTPSRLHTLHKRMSCFLKTWILFVHIIDR